MTTPTILSEEAEFLKVKERNEALKRKETLLKEEFEKHTTEYKKYCDELARINYDMGRIIEQIEEAKKDANVINEEQLHLKCKEAIEHFLKDTSKNQQKGCAMQIKIEYKNTTIAKNILDENMTFEKLKEETKLQFGKESREFYFADEDNHIFLDELNVLNALFPLSEVKVDKYEPTIRVADRRMVDVTKDLRKGYLMPEENIKQEVEESIWPQIRGYCKANSFNFVHVFLFALFYALWIDSCLFFRNSRDYQIFMSMFDLNSGISMPNATVENFLPNLQKTIANMYAFPTKEEINSEKKPDRITPFIEYNKNLGFFRMIQTRGQMTSCSNTRVNVSHSHGFSCFNKYSTFMDPPGGNNSIFIYPETKRTFQGIFNEYSSLGGFVEDIHINEAERFYYDMEALINRTWIDNQTTSITIKINLYNINIDLFLIAQFDYENMGNYLKFNGDYQLADITPIFDGSLIASIVFSVMCFFLMIHTLRVETTKPMQEGVEYHPNCCKRIWYSIKHKIDYVKYYYRCPDIFEFIGFINFLFYYGLIAFRYSYFNTANNAILSENNYTNLQEYSNEYELVTYLNCVNILIFSISIINHLRAFSEEFTTIASSLLMYLGKLYTFSLGFFIPFFLFSFFIAIFMFGDCAAPYYKNVLFIFLKIVQSFYRGTIDNIDYDRDIDRDKLIEEKQTLHYNIQVAKTPYFSVVAKIGETGYLLYTILFFIITYIIIKGTHMAYFLMIYRENHIQKLHEKEHPKKTSQGATEKQSKKQD